MTILVTGGAGYIGSHTCVELIEAGHEVVALDTLDNGHAEALARVAQITGRAVPLVEADIRDADRVEQVLRAHGVTAVIHFAGLKAVGESVADPLRYYDVNVGGTLRLCEAMAAAGVKTLVFSSSATVYGTPETLPLTESHRLAPENPYGHTKAATEQMLRDLHASDPSWTVILLRYFNPVGAHPSGRIGEDPKGVPNNLMPYVAQVATGRRPALRVFGDDYATRDGTGERDYIHVVDLARGHVRALEALTAPQCTAVNLGTGTAYSVLDVVEAFGRAAGRPIPYAIHPRRPGDLACYYADPSAADRLMGWHAEHDLDAMCRDVWAWQSANPDGYRGNG